MYYCTKCFVKFNYTWVVVCYYDAAIVLVITVGSAENEMRSYEQMKSYETDTVQLLCPTTSNKPITWIVFNYVIDGRLNHDHRTIYNTYSGLGQAFKGDGRYTIKQQGGNYTMTIDNIRMDDGGLYECTEHSSPEFRTRIRLNVSGENILIYITYRCIRDCFTAKDCIIVSCFA